MFDCDLSLRSFRYFGTEYRPHDSPGQLCNLGSTFTGDNVSCDHCVFLALSSSGCESITMTGNSLTQSGIINLGCLAEYFSKINSEINYAIYIILKGRVEITE